MLCSGQLRCINIQSNIHLLANVSLTSKCLPAVVLILMVAVLTRLKSFEPAHKQLVKQFTHIYWTAWSLDIWRQLDRAFLEINSEAICNASLWPFNWHLKETCIWTPWKTSLVYLGFLNTENGSSASQDRPISLLCIIKMTIKPWIDSMIVIEGKQIKWHSLISK